MMEYILNDGMKTWCVCVYTYTYIVDRIALAKNEERTNERTAMHVGVIIISIGKQYDDDDDEVNVHSINSEGETNWNNSDSASL